MIRRYIKIELLLYLLWKGINIDIIFDITV
jgi:hypothetical protein